jgi:hypothetical protein
MADSSAKRSAEKTEPVVKDPEIVFKCKFCGETKPLAELVIIRHYYPQLSSCRACSKGVVDHAKVD